jgi:hypothetical protein
MYPSHGEDVCQKIVSRTRIKIKITNKVDISQVQLFLPVSRLGPENPESGRKRGFVRALVSEVIFGVCHHPRPGNITSLMK